MTRSLPEETDEYYHYSGSLTTPPCSEGVKWYVMDEKIEASSAQITQFQGFFNMNARPIQPLNGRVITERND
ncbi:MAG TPA: carbonic anhydrase family protein [Gammaproteobacteria bacterium]|nr:carbonic anhydrase family protein [Gammaproteobacteria bacterium]